MRRKSRQPWYENGLRFECTQCGECCTGGSGVVMCTDIEVAEMSRVLGMPQAEFIERYAIPTLDQGIWEIAEVKTKYGYDCVLLGRDEETGKTWCTAHRARPSQCRTWPFWPENLHSKKSWKRAAQNCEGIGRGEFIPLKVIQREMQNTPEWGRPR